MRWLAALLLFLPVAAHAWLEVPFLKSEKVSDSAVVDAAAQGGGLRGGQEAKSALVRLLDKQNNRISLVVGAVGQSLANVPVEVKVARCVKSIRGVPGQDAAWLLVGPKAGGDIWFEGWMFNTYPDVATLDHPRYDVQLVGCDRKPEDRIAPVLPDIRVDTEAAPTAAAPKKATAKAGGVTDGGEDPYYVPGVGTGTTVVTDKDGEVPSAQENALHDLMDAAE